MKLNIGCGDSKMEGYVNIDCRLGKGDIQGDVRNMPDFSDGTFEEVYAHHILEHIPIKEVSSTLKEWTRWLAPGGVMKIMVPDMEYWCENLLRKLKPIDAIEHIYGGQDYPENFHYSGFTFGLLQKSLYSVGFDVKNITRVFGPEKDELEVWATK